MVLHVPQFTLMAVRKCVFLAKHAMNHRVDFSKEECANAELQFCCPGTDQEEGNVEKQESCSTEHQLFSLRALLFGLPFPLERGRKGSGGPLVGFGKPAKACRPICRSLCCWSSIHLRRLEVKGGRSVRVVGSQLNHN